MVVVAGLGTALMLEQQALTNLRERNRTLESQAAQLRQTAGRRAAETQDPAGNLALQHREQLRCAVAALRRETNDLASLRAKNHQLHLATSEPEDPVEAEFKEQMEARTGLVARLGLMFYMYAADHNDQFPTNFEQAADSRLADWESELEFGTNNLEIVCAGSAVSAVDRVKTILFRDKQTRCSPTGEWVKIYGFVNGHVEVHTEPDEAGFAAWEADHMVASGR